MNINRSRLLGCTIILVAMGVLCLVVITFGIAGIFTIAIKYKYDAEHGLNYVGAQHKFSTAMRAGDGQGAVYWAEKTVKFANQEGYKDVNRELAFNAYAYELDRQHEKALKIYQELAFASSRFELDISRAEYKQGKKKEAFVGYCKYVNNRLEKLQPSLESEWWNERNRTLGSVRNSITMQNDRTNMWLSPFLEYKDFLNFVEEEYQKLGEPPEYAAAMELFWAIDTEIDEKHLPRSGASAQLEAMRAKILAERKAKGVKW
ncbi:MAG: hypothetical protein FWH27_00610 [Planctomycetaceae bacterium]|nr:hypothetical protein [Planctomycetaceae bacterium]